MNQAESFLSELSTFSDQNLIEERDHFARYMKFHIYSRQDTRYYDKLLRALDYANRYQFMEVISYVAFIQQVDSEDSDRYLREAKQKSLERGINSLRDLFDQKKVQKFVVELGKLISPQKYCQLVQKISLLSDHPSSDPKQILTRVSLLENKIGWQIYKRRYFLTDNKRQSFGIMNQVLSNLRELTYIENPCIIEGKMSLIKMILQYFITELKGRTWKIAPLVDKIGFQKIVILGQVQNYYRSSANNIRLKFQLIETCVQLFGIYNQSYLSQIVNKNSHKYNILEEAFLSLVTTILSKPEKNRVVTKEIATKVLNTISESIIDVRKGTIEQNYKIVRKMCALMILINKQYVIDLTKNIVRQLETWSTKASQQLFLSALLLLFDFKMPEKLTNQLNQQSRKLFAHNKYQQSYYNFLSDFARLDYKVAQLRLDPEKCDQVIPWELQTIRLSICLNYQWLHELKLLSGVVSNLIRYILHNIYPQECAEIILIAIDEAQRNKAIKIHDDQYDKYWLRDVNLIEILQQIRNISETAKMPTTKSLNCFLEILTQLKKIRDLRCTEDLSLFLNVIHLLGIIITEVGRKDPQFLVIAIRLMRISLPYYPERILQKNLRLGLQMLECLMGVNLKASLEDILLELIYICLKRQEMGEIILSSSILMKINQKTLKIMRMTQEQTFQILCFMLCRKELEDETTLTNCWSVFSEALHHSQYQLCLYLQRLFSYFFHKNTQANSKSVDSTQYRLFLRQQITDTTQQCQQITNKINKSTLIEEIICLFQILQAFQTYLLDLMIASEKVNPNVDIRQFKVVQQYCNEVISTFCQQKWMFIIKQNENQAGLQKVFVANYFLKLLLLSNCLKRCPSHPGNYSRQSIIIKKFAWIENILNIQDRTLAKQIKGILMSILLPRANQNPFISH